MMHHVYDRPIQRLMRLAVGWVGITAAVVTAAAQESGEQAWLTGEALARQRQLPVKLSWSGILLRAGLAELATAQRVAILLDRRIDPKRPIDLAADRIPLDGLLQNIAEQAQAGVAWLGPVAYIGPREAASRLRTLAALRAADVDALPKSQRGRLGRESSWRWPALSEPRKLAAELASEANIEIESLELIAHDLWPAAALPPLSWTDRLSLLANQFDLTFELIDASHVRLTPIKPPIAIERRYPGGKQPAEAAARFKRLAPAAQIDVRRGQVIVRGRVEDHELLTPRKPPPKAAAGAEVYTMTVGEQTLADVLDQLRQQLAVDIRVDKAALEMAKLSLNRRVSFSVERATLEQLLSAALEAADLTFRKEGKVYKVLPRD